MSDAPIAMEHLRRPVPLEEAEKEAIPDSDRWRSFVAIMARGDELWLYERPGEYLEFGFDKGYAIVREGSIVGFYAIVGFPPQRKLGEV